jgi:two-component system, NarL family, nitrate/nitrite response regulator NarL
MPLRILIVDDVPLVRLGLRILMERHTGWAVCGEAQDGAEAIEKAVELDPDVILLDIVMPKMSGLTATPLIRERAPRAKIVILTLDASLEMARVASKMGASGFVSKSLLTSDLTSTIEAIEAAGNNGGGLPDAA